VTYSNRRIVLGFSAVIIVAFGSILYGFSVLVTDDAAGADFSTTVLSLGITGSGIVAALMARPLGRYMDRSGVRSVTVAGALLACAGMVAFSFARESWQVFAAWWLLIGPGTAAVYYEPSMVGIAAWVAPTSQPRAFGALTLLGGLAGAIFIPLTERLVSAFGWRPTVQILGVAILVTALIAARWAIPHGPGHYALESSPTPTAIRALLSDRRFVYFTVALLLAYLSVQGLVAHRVDRFTEAGFPLSTVAVWAGLASVISMPGRYIAPLLVARVRATVLTAGVFGVMALAILVAVPGSSNVSMIGHFALFGVAFGAITPLRAMVMTKWYAGSEYGEISGTQSSVMFFVAAFGATVVGAARDLAGSYVPILVALTVAVVLAAVLTIAAGRADDRLRSRSTVSDS